MTATLRARYADRAAVWSPAAWRQHRAAQQPTWPLPSELLATGRRLAARAALVTPGEVYALRRDLVRAAQARAFVVQAGDCAETFDGPHPQRVAAQIALIRLVCRIVGDSLCVPVIPIGRIAGQYAKPRSSPVEVVDGVPLLAYRGDLVNSSIPDPRLRQADPARLERGYEHAAQTLELLRSSSRRGDAIRGHWGGDAPALWTSHEALILDFEEPMVRRDDAAGEWVLTSTHLPWIGERTRQPDGAHVAFAAGLANPVGCKVGPTTEAEDLLGVCSALDPDRRPGRMLLIARMGAGEVARRLPPLVEAVHRAGHSVVWMSDPMHGNTVRAASGHKTRHVEAVIAELTEFFTAVRAAGGWPGGVHLECTSDEVTECVGGRAGIREADLPIAYLTACDPRLNATQTEEVARHVAELARAL